MNTTGTENLNRAKTPLGPAASQSRTPFVSSGLVVGSEASAFRPTQPPTAQTTSPFSSFGLVAGSEASAFRPMANGPSKPATPPSYTSPTAGPFQCTPTLQFSSTAQLLRPSPMEQPVLSQPVKPPGCPISLSLVSANPQSQTSSAPMQPLPQSINSVSSGANVSQPSFDLSFSAPRSSPQSSSPQEESSYPATGAALQLPLPGYPRKQPIAVTQASFVHSTPFLAHQGGYVPPAPAAQAPFLAYHGGHVPLPQAAAGPLLAHQRGHVTPPQVAALPGQYLREQMQHFSSVPPVGAAQGMIQDFSSLSLLSVPGSLDQKFDSRALPRPLEGDVEPYSFAKMYPMNCKSRYLRLTTNAIPNSQSLASRWHLPLGAVICPLAESPDGEEVPIINFSTIGIIRCRRCRTYVNLYVTFTDGGRKWRCNICALLNDVPDGYFAHLDASGRRFDLNQRPELTRGSVEFIAPAEYMIRPPMPPLYFFLIDVSVSAVRSGMLEVVAQTIRSCLDRLPGFPRTQIGFITFDSTIHFYNMKSSTQPQMLVVSDLDNIFVPLPDDLLVNLSESRTVVDAFLDSLPSMFQDNVNVESAFGSASKAALMIMSRLGGKLLIFQSTLPSLGVGRLRFRGDDLRIYGTDKECALRIPEHPFYKQMATDFSNYQIAVNLYAFSDKYTDLASLGTLAKYTGGQVCYYPSFQSAIHEEKLRHELTRDLTRETAWEAVMRIRCGKGLRFTTYHGNFMMRSSDLLALPAVDCDKAYSAQFCLEETLLTTQTVHFQVALLYTSSSGERRIRVHTAASPVVADLGEMFRQADTSAIVSLLSRLAIEKTLSHKLEDARSYIQLRIVKALREYRSLYSKQHRVGSRMIYPESLKFLPLYGLALCKSTPLRGGYADVQLDERCAAGFTMMALPVKRLLKLLYPNLIRIDEYLSKASPQADDFNKTWKSLLLSVESLDSRGLYIYDDGFRFVIWFGRMLSPDIAMNLFGKDFATDYSKVTLSEYDNEMSRKLMGVIKKFRVSDPSYFQLCHLVRQGEQPREGFYLLANLIEDQVGGTHCYIDWILQLHQQVQ